MEENQTWKVAIGEDNFEFLRKKQDAYYIDKSLLIKDVIENSSKVCLITRPRRFGKTLNMSMLESYFDIRKDSKKYFSGLKIMDAGEKYTSQMNSMPVIFLTFNAVASKNYEGMLKRVALKIAETYKKYIDLLNNEKIYDFEKEEIKKILVKNVEEETLIDSIKTLSEYLTRIYGKNVMILLDEYDVPLQNAYVNGYYDEAISFFKSFFASTFKSNNYAEKIILTGVSRVSKEGLFSGANNLDVYTVLNSQEFSDDFGVTENELDLALKAFKLEDKKQEVQEWYDGYKIGNVDKLCNTWSVLNYLKRKELVPYWVNTSSNDLIKIILKKSTNIKEKFLKLMQGDEIEVTINEETILVNIENSENHIWGLLLETGYLRVTEPVDIENNIYKVKLPNKEIHSLFNSIVKEWFSNRASGETLNEILQDLLNLNMTAFEWKFKKLVVEMFSYMDVKEGEAENFYHAFVLGTLVGLKDEYYIHSNRESGLGRYDIEIEPKDTSKTAFILEFKTCKDEQKMDEVIEEAKKQVEEKKYEINLKERGFTKITKIAFAFHGKNVEFQMF